MIQIDARYSFFWPWINSACDAAINQATCQKCADYSPVSCVADSSECPTDGNGNNDPTNIGCPYTYCREGVLTLLVGNISTFSYGALGLMGFTMCVALTACMLVCYTERDTIDKQVFKSGTLANTQFISLPNPGNSSTRKARPQSTSTQSRPQSVQSRPQSTNARPQSTSNHSRPQSVQTRPQSAQTRLQSNITKSIAISIQ